MATSSYTAALFESLRRAAAEPSGAPAAVSTPNYGLVPAPTPAAPLVLQTEPEGASAALQKAVARASEAEAEAAAMRRALTANEQRLLALESSEALLADQVATLQTRIAVLEQENARLAQSVQALTQASVPAQSTALPAGRPKELDIQPSPRGGAVAAASPTLPALHGASSIEPPTTPFKLSDVPASAASVRRGAGVRIVAPGEEEPVPAGDAATTASTSVAQLPTDTAATGSATASAAPVAGSAPASASTLTPSGSKLATTPAVTAAPPRVEPVINSSMSSLLARQEHLRQQEALLTALKQQQVQSRMLATQSARNVGGGVGFGGAPASPFGSARFGALANAGAQFGVGGGAGDAAAPGLGGAGVGFSARNLMGGAGAPFGSPTASPHPPFGAAAGVPFGGSGGGSTPSRFGMHSPSAFSSQRALQGSGAGVGMPLAGQSPFGSSALTPGGGSVGMRPLDRFGAPSPAGVPHGGAFGVPSSQPSREPPEFGAPGSDGFPPSLPSPGAAVTQAESATPPPGGWTVYAHPPLGVKWPTGMAFFQPMVDNGIPVLKHGRMGRPHKRLMWLDISEPGNPVLVWQEGDARNPARVKEKDRMPLVDIIDIKAGQASAILKRSGRPEDADKYISFAAPNRTLDIEMVTPEGREWVFNKFADLFRAYVVAKRDEALSGDEITLRVADIMDGTASSSHHAPAQSLGTTASASPRILSHGSGR